MRTVHASFPLLAAALVCSVVACGGKVVIDGSGGSGGAASTSTTSTSTTATTSTTTSASSTSGTGGSGACPVLAPNPGDPCSSPGLVCHVPVCCAGTATCAGDVWKVVADPCGQPCLPCPGTVGCAIGAVCVDNPIGGGPVVTTPHYNCAANPCDGAPLSCACAASLCEVGPCEQTSGSSVTCVSLAP